MESLGYDHLPKLHLFSDFNALCMLKLSILYNTHISILTLSILRNTQLEYKMLSIYNTQLVFCIIWNPYFKYGIHISKYGIHIDFNMM